MVKVLFVCLGNICRSPMAEGIFSTLVKAHNLPYECDSAGTSTYHIGELPDERMRATAEKNNIVLTHRARQLSKEDFDKFQYIVAMDKSNYQNILMYKHRVNNAAEPKIMLMRSFDEDKADLEVPDPYYGTMTDFDEVYEILWRTNQNFIRFLKEEHS
ncbi:MAG: low molecular weight protein-tyrosine-phosphatase [Microscillaceae bacterium]|nr:low molecular weight protein-tyrosine-phosphatase [Microscillaceae bacterium]